MTDLFVILVSTALVNNLFLEHALGAETAENFSRRLDVAIGLSITLILLTPLVCLFGFLIQPLLLAPAGQQHLALPAFVLLIFFLMALLNHTRHKLPAMLRQCTETFFPLAGINTAVFGALLLALDYSHSVFNAFIFGLGSAAGFSLSLLLLTGLRLRLEALPVPAPFRGLSITLITAGVMAMAFMGFTGLVQT